MLHWFLKFYWLRLRWVKCLHLGVVQYHLFLVAIALVTRTAAIANLASNVRTVTHFVR